MEVYFILDSVLVEPLQVTNWNDIGSRDDACLVET